jgi:hypothetical protein
MGVNEMKAIGMVFCVVLILSGCVADSEPTPQDAKRESPDRVWKNGQEVELTGTIWPSKGGTKYYIKGDDGKSAHLRSGQIAKLKLGTKIWVKGVVEYVHFPASKNPNERVAMERPQTLCYITVSKFRVIETP